MASHINVPALCAMALKAQSRYEFMMIYFEYNAMIDRFIATKYYGY